MNTIKLARERKRLSQVELAEQVGCTQAHISRLEASSKAASPVIAKRLATVLEINVLDILYPSHQEN